MDTESGYSVWGNSPVGYLPPSREQRFYNEANENAAESAAFFFEATTGQACFRTNSPIIGQMISRQRRPEKMP